MDHKPNKHNKSSNNLKQYIDISLLINRLGLDSFLSQYSQYFARILSADELRLNANYDNQVLSTSYNQSHSLNTNTLKHILDVLDSNEMQDFLTYFDSISILPELPSIPNLDNELTWLSKDATLSMQEVIVFARMIKFFLELQEQDLLRGVQDNFSQYIQSFKFPQEILSMIRCFDFELIGKHSNNSGFNIEQAYNCIKRGVDKELDSYRDSLDSSLKDKERKIIECLNMSHLQEFLVDTQIHFIENTQSLLVRPGFASVLPSRVIARSSHGFFYIVPLSLESLQQKIFILQDKIAQRIASLAKQYSQIYSKYLAFLRYVNKEFDFIDRIIARLKFARDYNLEFIFASPNSDCIILHDYAHPSINKPKPLSLNMSKNLLLITGVNAGGKTMLLKSILSAIFCVKYLIPFKINPHKSSIPFIQNIAIISQDPQDSKQDISTFSGRIKEFSKILHKQDLIVGIDEIELGTDSSEAASLYKVLLDYLLDHSTKIIITTHHKHLAALMSDNPNTQLLAALYDIKEQKPKYEFIEGIGKSYAMECAKIYGIPSNLIAKAKELHGIEANRLERLIEKSNYQITQNKQREKELETLITMKKSELASLEQAKLALRKEFDSQSLNLKRHYNEAIKEIKMLAREASKHSGNAKDKDNIRNIHKLLNKASKQNNNNPSISIQVNKNYEVGTFVKYCGKMAKVVSRKQIFNVNSNVKTFVYGIELENGMSIKGINPMDLEEAKNIPRTESNYTLQADIKAKVRLDLHGLTREEALASLEDFMSQALMAKFSEVIIVHGIGNNILRDVVVRYLDKAKFVRGFVDAPLNVGGSGAKIVYLF
ncbi:endonuclease MutS2 [Helicobacter muridarum]|nr:Smr/MutS family protein [Helicobacter muridarum]STQ86399.1 recombination and DNA strand exchange inhibitor protein [Helicobacter muridarum]